MNREIKMFLFDIRESIESIENFLGDKWDYNVYKSDKMLRRAGYLCADFPVNLTIKNKEVKLSGSRV